MNLKEVFDFYKGKKVLVTGHTGFKGTWLSRILVNAGAKAVSYTHLDVYKRQEKYWPGEQQ